MSRQLCNFVLLVGLLVISLVGRMKPVEAQQLGSDLQRANNRFDGESNSAADAEVDRIAADAATLYRSGEVDKAIDEYDRAAAAAFRSGATGRAFEFSLVAAELERNQGNWLSAADRFERAALANSNDPRAAMTHYLACQSLTEFLKRGNRDSKTRLDRMLEEHGQMWPNSPTASKAAWQRIELLAVRAQWDNLLAAVKTIPVNDQHFGRSQELLVLAHRHGFAAQLQSNQQMTDMTERLSAMTIDLEEIVLGKSRRWPTRWTELQCQAAETLARAHLSRGQVGADYAQQLLGVAIKGNHDAKQELRDSMIVLSTISAIIGENYSDADSQLAELMPDTNGRRALLQATRDRLLATEPMGWSQEADHLLKTIRALRGPIENNSSLQTETQSELAQVDALDAAGRREEALRLLDDLIAAHPKEAKFSTVRAKLLSKGSQTKELELALRSWHEIEARSTRSTDAWFEARLERLRLLIRLDRKEEASKLLKLTKLLAPTLGGSELAKEFQTIESQLKQ